MSERFGSLRSLLHEPPSRGVWLEVCEELERWPPGGPLEVAIPYARGILSGWPAEWMAPPDHHDMPPDLPWVGLVRRVLGPFIKAASWVRAVHDRGGWIDHLSVSGGDAGALLSEVLERARALEHLAVGSGQLGPRAAADLAARALPRLRGLSLGGNPLGEEGCYALARAPWWRALESVELAQAGVSEAAALTLLARPMPRLRALDLSSNAAGDPVALALCAPESFAALRVLDLSCNEVGDSGALALEEALGAQLEALDLSYNQIGPRVVALFERLMSRRPGVIIDVSENTLPRGYVDPFGEDDGVEEISWRDWERADDLDEWETWTTWKRDKG